MRMMIGTAWVLLFVALAGCTDDGDGTGDGATTHDVDVDVFQFRPATLTIAVGDAVRWTNQDSDPHTATGADFDTGGMAQGESEEVTFDTAGSFEYVCTFHDNMKGIIVVE